MLTIAQTEDIGIMWPWCIALGTYLHMFFSVDTKKFLSVERKPLNFSWL